jgi:hypothetical protein
MAKSGRSRQSASKKKTTQEIVRRHLSNKNDKITEDDFKNLDIDLSIPKDVAPLPVKNKKKRPKDVNKDHTTITPWDVINE